MVELKLYVSEVDYESVMQALGGHLAGPMALAARALPDSAKEELVVKYINASAGQMESWLENALSAKGLRMKISGAQASLVRPGDM